MGPRSRSPSPRGDYRGKERGRDDERKPMSLLVRGLPRDIRPEDIRSPFERYGSVRDVYLPRDYYTKQPRGFGFVEFYDERDAHEAQYQLDRTMFMGREITVVYAQEDRKRPEEMRRRDPPARDDRRGYDRHDDRRRDDSRRGDRGRHSRSPSPRRRRSPSPDTRDRSGSDSRSRSRSASEGRSRSRSRSRS